MEELLITSKDCPYNCVNGVLFHPRTHVKTACPFCQNMRMSSVLSREIKPNDEDIETKLGLKKRIVSKQDYTFESIFRTGIDRLDPSSTSVVRETLDKLVSDLSLGDLPSHSMLFNLGARVFEENFVNPLLVRAYLGGLTVAPLLSAHIIADLRRHAESTEYVDSESFDIYNNCISADFCVVVLDEGITKSGVDLVAGFVSIRGRSSKPTVILTHSILNTIMYEFATTESYFDYSVPKLVSIKYSKKDSIASKQYVDDKVDTVEVSSDNATVLPQMTMRDLNAEFSGL